ncbi:MAG: DUF512 domain-containing protein [Oscillospiraceae bacterium]|nr:DUF512 domain-containing protein [Oscillospiraceae bacterium]
MAVKIKALQEASPADSAGVRAGDILVSINGQAISDVLDYMFYSSEEEACLSLIRGEEEILAVVKKSEYEDLGLIFDSFLLDEKQSCNNNCVFCFIDQNPAGMRETIYFKDDDARLSFLQGNYVTLNGLDSSDIDRMIKMRLSINISVHTTNPALRCRMMNNRFAGEKLNYLNRLFNSEIKMNCQIVLCPGLNDGDELVRTLTDLGGMYPAVQSIAVVPVGLTKHRNDLYELTGFDEHSAKSALKTIERFQKLFLSEYGTRLVFAADELYLKANLPFPKGRFYEDYCQFDNGVGMARSLMDEFKDELKKTVIDKSVKRNISVVTGMAAGDFITKLTSMVTRKRKNIKCRVFKVTNHFFGETVTVAGLLTAQDMIARLEGQDLGTELLISEAMLKKDCSLFLDGYTIAEVEERLKVKIRTVPNSGREFLKMLIAGEEGKN